MQALDASAIRRWADACVRSLAAHREDIDRINVFPVADGDTGTNLLQTMRSALDSLLRSNSSGAGTALSALAKGALAGARGNSGVILSQVLRGLAEAVGTASTATGASLRKALLRADELAAEAVSAPSPGTVLSVLHAAAEAARDCPSDELGEVASAASRASAAALAETPRQLAVLARAGVVDAGGRGLVVLLDALAGVVTGHVPEPVVPSRVPRPAAALTTARESGSAEYEYEVMYLIDGLAGAGADRSDRSAEEEAARALRTALRALGDCVSVVGDGDGLWTVHVHCNDIGAAVEAGVEAGRPHRITVSRFADQVAAQADRFTRDRAVVALVRGDGVAELFEGEGAVVLRVAGALDPADLLAVLTGTRARHVVVLPGVPDLRSEVDDAVSQAVAAGQDAVVVPMTSPVQALAALAVHDASRRANDDVVAMAEAAAATRRGEIGHAVQEAITWVGRCLPGDLLALLDGEVVHVEPGPGDRTGLARDLVDLMLVPGGELVTALLGEDAPDGLAEALEAHLRVAHPEVELVVYPGGLPGAVLVVGVE
ncbi:DAK2 domain-containing protein [Actinosynnema pretiosum]|uniref:Dihydroxyacetone kinase n=1 Tax=Actinosynnema pretiosum TaxID=42197 RepID=A0A290ZD44_9PSEU|nr:DAK2 domain-containing protein [Actinosynnema pretiosum]ATE56893.1 dihydroxyacetone kinase [Actinosynnema pretiosum]